MRLIDAEALIQDSEDILTWEMLARINKAETIEAEPVRHGRWMNLEPEIGLMECNLCGHKILRAPCNYCPSCGAKMMDEVSE